mgnify:CR=1 FL=1
MSLSFDDNQTSGMSLTPLTQPEPVINPGTYSVGYLHPDVPWIEPGFYKCELPNNRVTFLYLHDAINRFQGDHQCVHGHTPLMAGVMGHRFVTATEGPWVLIERIRD